MNPDVFAEWLRLQGHRVIKTDSSYWYNQGPRVFQAFPYHWIIQPSEKELSSFLVEQKAVGLRFSTNWDAPEGYLSYHAVFEGEMYGLDHLGKWARKNVRRGLKNCEVLPISFDLLAKEGLALQIDTLDRQGRKLSMTKEVWEKRCLAARDLPGFEAWGAFVNHLLVASVIVFQMDECAYLLYQQCLRAYLAEHVNNALSFTVTQNLGARSWIKRILYGLHSLDAPPSVDEFKFRMGYTVKPVRQRVLFHPKLSPFINPYSYHALRAVVNLLPNRPILAKAEGMMRFYIEGKLPIENQPLHTLLAGQREEILQSVSNN